MEKRICEYRRCNNDISEMRKDAKFCCRGCKDMEKTYRKRKVKLLKKYKENNMIKVEQYKKLVTIIENNTTILK